MVIERRAVVIALSVSVACSKSGPTASPGAGTATPPSIVATGTVRLTASDVTMIWPMPADAAQRDTMLAATSMGGHGELLPANLYDVPLLDERDSTVTNPKEDRARLRVVAARFEPCRGSFGPPTDPACLNQIRLVMQVLRPGGGGAAATTMAANDGAVLAFYKITREELLGFARDIAALRDANGGSATATEGLGVHPVLARQGLGSEYAKQLQAKLLALVGAERLTKITFFVRTAAREPLWPFGGFNVVDGKLAKKIIPTLTVDRQTLEGAAFRKVIEPTTSSPDNPDALLSVMGPQREATAAERAAYASLLRIQNPKKHNPDTMACAECHVAQRMQVAAEKTLGLRATDFAADNFASTLQPVSSKIDSENFHAVAYLGTNLAVTMRTANDTSAVLQEMSTLLGQ
jgi:hypothetical protein